MRRERMLGYYPSAIQSILEFNAIVDTEFPVIDDIDSNKECVLLDAYLTTMSERRITQWERKFGIQPAPDATLENRRDVVIARIRGQGKLNTALINTIVKSFTGEGCDCWIKDSVLYVELEQFDESKISPDVVMANITNELSRKIPAHLGLRVQLIYKLWGDVNSGNRSWETLRLPYPSANTWKDVLNGRRVALNRLDYSQFFNPEKPLVTDVIYLG